MKREMSELMLLLRSPNLMFASPRLNTSLQKHNHRLEMGHVRNKPWWELMEE